MLNLKNNLPLHGSQLRIRLLVLRQQIANIRVFKKTAVTDRLSFGWETTA
jgi:hypothetical protein